MNHSELELAENAVDRAQGDWDVNTIAEQIFGDLNGTVALSTIHEVIKEVVPKYEGARIQTFVPIFIRRDAVDQLRAMQSLFATPALATDEADARSECFAETILTK